MLPSRLRGVAPAAFDIYPVWWLVIPHQLSLLDPLPYGNRTHAY